MVYFLLIYIDYVGLAHMKEYGLLNEEKGYIILDELGDSLFSMISEYH